MSHVFTVVEDQQARPSFTFALADDAAAEQMAAEDARRDARDCATAADLDRDLAVSYLIAELPAGMYFRLSGTVSTFRIAGEFKTESTWIASVAVGDGADNVLVTASLPTPAAAAMALVDAYKEHADAKAATPADEPTPEINIVESASGKFRASARIRPTDKWESCGKHLTREAAEVAARGTLQSMLREHAAERDARTTGIVGRIAPERAADAIEAAAQQCGDTSWMVIDTAGVVSIAAPFRGKRFEDWMLDTARYACDVVNGKIKFAEPVTAA